MESENAPRGLTLLAVAIGIVRPLAVWDALPPVMASHFSADGMPDATSTKEAFFLLLGGTFGFVLLSLWGSVVLMDKIPVKYLNLPHKEYWQQGRMGEARQKMVRAMWWMTAATAVFCVAVLELVLQANLQRAPLNGTLMWIALGGYFIFTLFWTVKMFTTFRPPDADR